MKRYNYIDSEQGTRGLIVITFTDTNGLSKVQQNILNDGWLIENVDFSPSRAYFYVRKKNAQKENKPAYKVSDKFCNHYINPTTIFTSADDSIQLYSAEKNNPIDEWTRRVFRYQ